MRAQNVPHAAQAVRPGKLKIKNCSAAVDSLGVFRGSILGLPQALGNANGETGGGGGSFM